MKVVGDRCKLMKVNEGYLRYRVKMKVNKVSGGR